MVAHLSLRYKTNSEGLYSSKKYLFPKEDVTIRNETPTDFYIIVTETVVSCLDLY